jgi:glyoxylase-like metal-dependent hydrolase (beta-lactamase superfamily II)
MRHIVTVSVAASIAAIIAIASAAAQQPQPQQPQQAPPQGQQRPPFETTKVEGTDNVYIFRNGGAQSMFIVTSDGVIATDPISYGRPSGGQTYVDEIKKVTNQPIKYLIYSHHHFDHIAGGKAFKDAGASIIAHRRAQERLAKIKDPHTPLPDETLDTTRTITRWHHARAALSGPEPFGLKPGDAAAEGKNHLRRRHDSGRHAARPRDDRLLSA